MKKYILIVAAVLTAILICCSIVACVDDNTPVITPSSWETYVKDVISYAKNTYGVGDKTIGFEMVADLHNFDINNSVYTKSKITIKFNLDLNGDRDTDGLLIKVDGIDVNGSDTEILSVYANEDKIYLHLYESIYNKHSYYAYENAPLFDLLRKYLPEEFENDSDLFELLNINVKKLFTGAYVNSDKSVYNLNFSFAALLEGKLSSVISGIFAIMPLDIKDGILDAFSVPSVESLLTALSMVGGDMTVNVKSNRIESFMMKANVLNTSSIQLNVNKLSISPSSVEGVSKIQPDNLGDYKSIKIATLSVDGKIYGRDEKNTNTIVTYDVSINMSVDLLQLWVNDWDIESLDKNNYFHIRVSHTCGAECTDYCSVEMGNKYLKPNGAILDVAFSPKDFDTDNLYISVSTKAFIGENFIKKYLNASYMTSLINLILSDYQLITLDMGARNILATEQSDKNTEGSTTFEQIVKMISVLNAERWKVDFNMDEFVDVFSDIYGDNDLLYTVNKIFRDFGIRNVNISMDMPQYDSLRDYEIDKSLLFIPAIEVSEGTSGTKQYNNAILGGDFDPTIDWEFDKNVLYGSKYGTEIMYSDSVPISPEELKNLSGAYVKYYYTDMWRNKLKTDRDDNYGFAKVMEVVNVDYTQTGRQKVLLKVGFPSAPFCRESIGTAIRDMLDKMFYTSVEIDIKLTPLKDNGVKVDRTDKQGGEIKTDYKLSESFRTVTNAEAQFTYADGSIKNISVTGNCDFLDKVTSSFIPNKTGVQTIFYDVCGQKFEFDINIIPVPDENAYLTAKVDSSTYNLNELITVDSLRQFTYFYHYEGESEKSIILPYTYITIDGTPITNDSYQWHIVYKDNKEYLSFLREGVYKIEANYMGLTAAFDLKINSKVAGEASYKISDVTTDTLYFADSNYVFRFTVDNKSHGSIGQNAQKLMINIKRAGKNANGSILYEENVTDSVLKKLTYDGKEIGIGTLIDIEPLILEPHKLNLETYFARPGYYRIEIYIGAYYKLGITKDIEVRNWYE